jgi:hypothetical protein
MKQFSQQFHKKAEATVKLQAVEKHELRERVLSYMEYHPLPAEMKAKQPIPVVSPVMTEAFTLVKVPFHVLFKYGAAVAVVLLVIVPFVAEKAVPGDVLYAIKVQFNEELRGTLTFGGFEKVQWETERLNRRIAEARLLASEGRLTEEVEGEMAAAVREHTESAKREIDILRTQDADEATIASIALETTLEVQATALKAETTNTLEGEVESGTMTTSLIADAIDDSRDKTSEPLASSTLPAYEKLMARVEQNTTRIYELQVSLGGVVTPEEAADVTRRSEDIGRLVEQTIALATTDEVAAQQALVEILQRSQRLIVFMTELEVSRTVDIETLVPVVPTEAEKQATIASSTAALSTKIEQIAMMRVGVEDVAVLEKVAAGEATILELSAKMASSTNEYESFILLATEAQALAGDVLLLLERYYIPTLPEGPETLTVEEASSTPEREDTASSTEEVGTDVEASQGGVDAEGGV